MYFYSVLLQETLLNSRVDLDAFQTYGKYKSLAKEFNLDNFNKAILGDTLQPTQGQKPK